MGSRETQGDEPRDQEYLDLLRPYKDGDTVISTTKVAFAIKKGVFFFIPTISYLWDDRGWSVSLSVGNLALILFTMYRNLTATIEYTSRTLIEYREHLRETSESLRVSEKMLEESRLGADEEVIKRIEENHSYIRENISEYEEQVDMLQRNLVNMRRMEGEITRARH